MHTARLPTIRVSMVATRYQYWGKIGAQMNKFEQVSSDDQMSVGGGVPPPPDMELDIPITPSPP